MSTEVTQLDGTTYTVPDPTPARIPVELPEGMAPAIPEGKDPLDDLTVTELDIVSRQIKADVYEAMGGLDGLRWAALARLAWLWAKRRDPHAKLQPFLDLTGAQLTEVLRLNTQAEDQAPELDADENPTDATPAH